ncbi:MAG: hypothetical protein K2G49_11165 [Muribaculum sp.]|nr:hypothetical protein [Muribaculum sp.]
MIHNTQCRGEWKLARATSTTKQRRNAARLHPLIGINCARMTWRAMNIRRATSQSPLQLRGVIPLYILDSQHAM